MTIPQERLEETRYALSVLYYSTNGKYWSKNDGFHTNPKYNECEWYGIACNEEGQVMELSLGKHG